MVVVGSINMDLVGVAERLPAPGETVLGRDFRMVAGGKGANQAVAVARLGRKVAIVGRVGADSFGQTLRAGLESRGVDVSAVTVDAGAPTGVALIMVDSAGENRILVVPGANGRLSPDDVARHRDVIAGAKVLLLQLEIPVDTVEAAARLAREHGATVILDPAPARSLPSRLFSLVDILVPNEREAAQLLGWPVTDLKAARSAASGLLALGVRTVVLKVGAQGAVVASGSRCEWVRGYAVEAVDSTGAGDAFAGGLAAALIAGEDLLNAVAYANAVGALATTRVGAQEALPTGEEVMLFLSRQVPPADGRQVKRDE